MLPLPDLGGSGDDFNCTDFLGNSVFCKFHFTH